MIAIIQIVQLIKSLSKEEKRFFKLNASYGSYKGEKQYYLQLFDLIDAVAGEFDEKKFRQQHKSATWFSNYANLKKYLYEALIKSLLLQQQQKNNFMQVSTLLQSAAILRERALYEQAETFLNEAQVLAEKVDMQAFLPLIIYQKLLLYTAFLPAQNPSNNIEIFANLGKSLALASQSANLYFEQYSIYHQLFNFYALYNTGLADSAAETLEQIKSSLDKYEAAANLQNNAISTNMYYLRNRAILQMFSASHDESHDTRNYHKEIVLLFEQQPDFAQQKPKIYANSLSNLISFSTRQKDFETAAHYLALLDYRRPAFKKNSANDQIIQRFHTITLQLNLYVESEQLEEGLIFYENQKEWLNTNKSVLPLHSRLFLNFWIGLLFFERQDFNAALQAWAVFFHKPLPTCRPWQNLVLLLRLLIFWQREEWALLVYRCQQTKRILKKQGEWAVFHQQLFKFLYRSYSQPLRRRKAARLWLQYLVGLPSGDALKEANSLFDYEKWVKRQLG